MTGAPLYICDAMVLDAAGTSPFVGTVCVEGDRISGVGTRDDFGAALEDDRAEIIDARGLWLLPGLINMHDHLTLRYVVGPTASVIGRPVAQHAITAAQNARDAIRRGWTSVRDMGGAPGVVSAVKDHIRNGTLIGPRILTVASPLCVTGGHARELCREADGPDEFRRAAREQLRDGADIVKVMASHDPYPMPGAELSRPEMAPDEVSAAFDEARRWGKLTACHAMGRTAIKNVLDAGVDVVDHGVYLDEPLAERMAESRTYLCPTLSSYDRKTMDPRYERGEEWAEAHQALVQPHERSAAIAVQEGVQFLCGTDTVGSYSEEVELMRAAGLTALETICACTSNAAEALGLGGDLGRVGMGCLADLVVLDGDPLNDSSALDRVRYVIQSGSVTLGPSAAPASLAVTVLD